MADFSLNRSEMGLWALDNPDLSGQAEGRYRGDAERTWTIAADISYNKASRPDAANTRAALTTTQPCPAGARHG